MKIRPAVARARFAALVSLIALAATSPARADTYTWTGAGGNPNWGTPGNWLGNTPPPSSPDTGLIFAGTTNLAPQQNIAASFLLNALTFDGTAGAFTLGGNLLDFRTSTGGALPTLTQNSASAETINNALALTDNLVVGGAGAGVLTLGGIVSGAGSLTMAGSGTTLLTGNNTYTGGTVLQAGVLRLGSAGALGSTGLLSFSGGTLQFSAANASDYSDRFNGAGNQAIRLDTNGRDVVIGYGFGGGGTSLTKLGAGTLVINGANSYTGTTNLLNGVVSVNNPAALGSNGPISFGGGALQYGNNTDAAFNAADYSARFSTATPQVYSIDTNGHNITYATGLTNGNVRKLGAGNLTLAGANTYQGSTDVLGGTLTLGAGTNISGPINVQNNGAGAALAITGSARVTGATYLYLSSTNANPASLTLGDSSRLSIDIVYIQSGGVFNQTGGVVNTNDYFARRFILGGNGARAGTYNLSGTGSLNTGVVFIGSDANGLGVFNQTGGSFTTNRGEDLYLGYASESNGTYNLSGTGSLSASGPVYVGYDGTGAFNQSAGSLSLNLKIGYNAGSNGTYSLSGTGSLSTGVISVGYLGTGTFNQSGGSFDNGGKNLILGNDRNSRGTYNLSGTGNLSTGVPYVGYDGTGTFNQTGGAFTTNNNQIMLGYNASGRGTYNFSGGSLTTPALIVGHSGLGVFNQSGGTFNGASQIYLGFNGGSSGTYNLSGGSLSTGNLFIGNNAPGVFNQSGGVSAFTGGNALYVGYNGGGGTYNLSGVGSLSAGVNYLGYNGPGTFNQTGGAFTVTGGNPLLLGANAGSAGTYNLTGGTLTPARVTGGAGASTFNFNGGTLQAGAASVTFFQGLTAANLQTGGAKIDSNGFDVTVAQNLLHGAAVGALAIDGGLTKLGAGTLTLTGINTYTGPTTISAGALSVAGDAFLGAASGVVNIGSGGSLVFTNSLVSTGRTFNLANSALAPASGGSITYDRATVNGGTLGAGNQILAGGTTLNGVRTANGTALSQGGGTVTFNGVLLAGNSTFTQTGGATLNAAGDFIANPQTNLTINGTVNPLGALISGALTVNNGGKINQSGSSPLYLDGTRGATINAGGQLNAASGSTVELGGLLVNNGAQTGVLNVNLGGVARGSGSFGTVNVGNGGRFSPGNSPGTATVESLNLQAAGAYQFELNSAAAADAAADNSPGNGADLINVTGRLTIAAGVAANSRFTISIVSLDHANNPAPLGDFDASQSYRFVLATAAGIDGFNPGVFNVDTSGFANGLNGGSFSVAQDGNHLDLVFTSAVPEPGAWALLLTGAAGAALVAGSRRFGRPGREMRSFLADRKIRRAVSRGRFAARAGLLALVAAAIARPAHADTYTWTGAASDPNWSTSANWQGNTPPPSSQNTSLIFTGGANLAPQQNNPAGFLLNAISFNAAGAFTLGGNLLDFRTSTGGASPTITQNSNNAETINNDLALTNNLTLNLNVDFFFLTGLTLGGNISGAGSLTTTGNNTTLLTGNNTYTGGTVLQGGTLRVGSAGALGSTGLLSFSGGTLQFSAANASDYSDRFNGAGNQAIRLDTNGQNVTIGTGFGGGGTSLTKRGAGTLTINGANSYTGATDLVGGVVLVNNISALGSDGTIAFSGGVLRYGDKSDIVYNAFDFSPRFSTAAGQAYNIDTNGHNLTYATGLTSSGGALTKLGAGNLTLAGANTYTGATKVNEGNLTVGTGGSLSGTSALDLSAAAAGTFAITGTGSVTLNSDLSLDGPGTIILGGTGNLSTRAANIGYNGTGVFNQSGGTFNNSGLTLGYNPGSNGTYTLSGTGSLRPGASYIGYNGTGTFNQSGGSFTTNGNALYLGYNSGSRGTYTLSGTGGLTATGGRIVVGENGAGVFNQSGGTLTGGSISVGSESGGDGTYHLSGTGSMNPSVLDVGANGTGVFNQSGGVLTTGNRLDIGLNPGSKGTYNLSDSGFLTVNAPVFVGDSGTGVFNQNGGTFNSNSLTVIGYLSGSSGTYTLGGGTLTTPQVYAGASTSTFNFNGGTLRAIPDNFTADMRTFVEGLTAANVQLRGARIDSNGIDITIAQSLLHDTASGAPALDGGLTKLGAGTLTLTGVNTYTGPTTISAGTLSVPGDVFLGATGGVVNISSGASLVFTSSTVTTGHTFNLANSALAPSSGGSITYARATVNGGTLGAGNQILAGGTTLNGVRTANGTALSQGGGTVTFNNLLLAGNSTFTQAAGATLNSTGDFISSPQTGLTVNGTVNAAGGSVSGLLTINSVGKVNQSGNAPLYLDGSRGTTVNAGGQLNAASGSTLELGGLLINNGVQTGVLNVNLGGVARGSGSFGTVNVGASGRFGVNTLAAGASSPNALAAGHLRAADGLAEAAFVGPRLRVVPGTANVGNLTLGSGSLLAASVQDARGTKGAGYDTVQVQGALTLNGYRTAGDQITIALSSLGSNGSAGVAANFDPSQSYVLTLVTASGGITGFDAASFQVDASSFQNSLGGGHFFVAQDGNNLNLDFTPVPEPATWLGGALLLVGAAGTIRRRVRRSA